ncbi:hypothetical protein J6590_033129 [Homalodisca vitripennis]|nr:hypothetical protein J6590_033129 [Homalodisca vitripennis]
MFGNKLSVKLPSQVALEPTFQLGSNFNWPRRHNFQISLALSQFKETNCPTAEDNLWNVIQDLVSMGHVKGGIQMCGVGEDVTRLDNY